MYSRVARETSGSRICVQAGFSFCTTERAFEVRGTEGLWRTLTVGYELARGEAFDILGFIELPLEVVMGDNVAHYTRRICINKIVKFLCTKSRCFLQLYDPERALSLTPS